MWARRGADGRRSLVKGYRPLLRTLDEFLALAEANGRIANLDDLAAEHRKFLEMEQEMYYRQMLAGFMAPAVDGISSTMDILKGWQPGVVKQLTEQGVELLSREGMEVFGRALVNEEPKAIGDGAQVVMMKTLESRYDVGEFKDDLATTSTRNFRQGYEGLMRVTAELKQFDLDVAAGRVGAHDLAKIILEARQSYRLDSVKTKISMIRLMGTDGAATAFAVHQDSELRYARFRADAGSTEAFYVSDRVSAFNSTQAAAGASEIEMFIDDFEKTHDMSFYDASYEHINDLYGLHSRVSTSYNSMIRPVMEHVSNYHWYSLGTSYGN